MLAHFIGEAAHEFDPAGQWLARPVAHRLARALDCSIDIARLATPDFLAGRRFG